MAESSKTKSRGHILAAKLRENLKRRKAQARARSASEGQAASGSLTNRGNGDKGA